MTDQRIRDAERTWRSTGTFEHEQAYLEAKLRAGQARRVTLDPDGSRFHWAGVVVRQATGVVYAHQVGGTRCAHHLAEGFYVPLGGNSVESRDPIDPRALTAVFHRADGWCDWTRHGAGMSDEDVARLEAVVASIPCWGPVRTREKPVPLQLDPTRTEERCEGWIPVETPYGPGVLVHWSCD